MARRRKRGRRKARRKTARRSIWLWLIAGLFLLLAGYIAYLDFQVRHQFAGKRWSLPARVYARPLELYAGQTLGADQFAAELKALQYRPVRSPARSGEYSRNANRFHLLTRPFDFWSGSQAAQNLRVTFKGESISRLADGETGKATSLARLDPVLVGSFYPSHNEDRVLLQLDEVPVALTDALIAVEDRGFYRHHGIAPLAIARAMWANIRARGVVQGGSTLTQQLVKNFFLSSERTLLRKINEAFMALLLEWHYEKDEILEAYLNEVYLGQDGQRSINGFGLASYFYFERPLAELTVERYALLVGLVKGPSYYNPRRHPERARSRRNLVLDVMAKLQLIDAEEAERAKQRVLGVSDIGRKAINTFPAFLELVRHQLQTDYRDEDITSEGLRIFTTLDPQVQWQLEKVLAARLRSLESSRGIEAGTLEGAAVISSVQGGEVLALAGGRDPGFAGFNRALNAKRQVGSLLKPAVYLTALEQPQRYTLATLVDDSPLTFTSRKGDIWEPHNYDLEDHGQVALYRALAHSYNVATARLGLALGLDAVIDTLRRLGIEQQLNPYPSLVLGAVELSPLEVTRMYQTFASGGFRMPLRAISAVLAVDRTPLQRYPLSVQSVIDPAANLLISNAMQYAVREGTGVAIFQTFPQEHFVAGKTGTTDDLRDSWFAGFTDERLGVVWIGRDDNQSTGLTGSSGALLVWRDLFSQFTQAGWTQPAPEGIEYHWIDPVSGLLADAGCADAVQLPFISSSAPLGTAPCKGDESPRPGTFDWFKRLLE
ncbi:MAG: penicillin-binding protein 1B [Gammaproteobacteria bacterium]